MHAASLKWDFFDVGCFGLVFSAFRRSIRFGPLTTQVVLVRCDDCGEKDLLGRLRRVSESCVRDPVGKDASLHGVKCGVKTSWFCGNGLGLLFPCQLAAGFSRFTECL